MYENFSGWLTTENSVDFQTALLLRETQVLHLKQKCWSYY